VSIDVVRELKVCREPYQFQHDNVANSCFISICKLQNSLRKNLIAAHFTPLATENKSILLKAHFLKPSTRLSWQAKLAYWAVINPDKHLHEHVVIARNEKTTTVRYGTPALDGLEDAVLANKLSCI
jgi:hypothetical protein